MSKPQCFIGGHMHPADEQALEILVAEIRAAYLRLRPGRSFEFTGFRAKDSAARIGGKITEARYPLEEDAA